MFNLDSFKKNIANAVKNIESSPASADTTAKVGFAEGVDDGIVLLVAQIILATQKLEFAENLLARVEKIKAFLPSNIEELIYLDEIEVACRERIAYLKNK